MNVDKPDVFQSGENFRGYVVERLLGKGGIGAVYLVRHEILDTLYALKVLYPDVARTNPNYIKRFLREAKIATRIRHPNLVAVHDCGFDSGKGLYYLVQDYVIGGDLRQALAFSGKFEPDKAVGVIAQVAKALDAAQKFGVVHRDIKPENIMLQPDGSVKLVDLGIAKASSIEDSLKTTTESVFGTPTYVSPEQALSAADVDTRADVYSLGIVLFEMIAGRCPYEGKNAPQILAQVMSEDPVPDVRDFNPDVPPMLAATIRRMCVKDRNRRIATPAALLAEFAKLGYVNGDVAPEVSYTPTGRETRAAEKGIGEYLRDLPKDSNDTLSFETDDVEIQAFVRKLKRRRLKKRIAFAAAIFLLAVLVILVLTV